MTTKTTINLSPIKRCHGSANFKKRRLLSSSNTRTMSTEKPIRLPDLVHDIFIEQHRRETIVQIANTLRKVGDQMDEQLQINNTSSSTSIDHIFGQRSITFIDCLSRVLRCFL